MALAFTVPAINDLDSLSATSLTDNANGTYDTTEIHVDAVNRKFYLKGAGNLANAGTGITGQALYSFFKYIWKNTASITRYDFPMLSITNEQFEFINGWSYDDSVAVTQTVTITGDANIDFNDTENTITHTGPYDFRQFQAGDTVDVTGTTSNNTTYTVISSTKDTITVASITTQELNQTAVLTEAFSTVTSKMIRTAGWGVAESANGGVYNKVEYAGVVTLGTFVDVVDRAYYIQDTSFTAATNDTTYTGPVNEAVVIKKVADANSGSTPLADITFTGSNTITTPANGTDLSVFSAGDIITVTNTASNNGTYTVTGTPTATSMSIVETGTAEGPVGAVLTVDYSSVYKLFLRERGKLYADSQLSDIGVTTMTYIVYRFPLSNGTDLKILTTVDTQIDADSAVPASEDIYDAIQVKYLVNPAGGTTPVNIVGPYTNGATYALGDVVFDATNSQAQTTASWYYVSATPGTSSGADMNSDTQNTWTRWDDTQGEREVNGVRYAFSVIIDAEDTHANAGTPYTFSAGASKDQVYEFAQWALRLTGQLNEGATGNEIRNGNVAEQLVEFIGDVLHTKPGVFIDSFKETDANSIVFHDYADNTAGYPLTVTVTINFNSNLSSDADAVFRAYYTELAGENDFNKLAAIEVNKADATKVGSEISNAVPGSGVYEFSYAYDEDTAGGNRTVSNPTDITVVAIGLNTGQHVKASGQITTTGATISLVAPLERNYSNPT